MSGVSVGVGSFLAADYVVFALILAVPAVIGVYYGFFDKSESSSGEFFTAGRKMTALPVSLSLAASFMSAVTMLSTTAEAYLYGVAVIFFGISYLVMVLVTSEIFVPLFYKLSVTSTDEYLELRFNRATRLLGAVCFVVETTLYTGIIIYGPALALNKVTGVDLWGVIISTGVVCTFYCSVGGLKAVVWTDVFQFGVMLTGFLSVIVRSVVIGGGVMPIISDSQHGGRLSFLDFDMNPLRKHTFWTITIGGSFLWISIYGINMSQVQRYRSCKTIGHARLSLYINLLGMWLVLFCSVFSGICLYSIYKNCDPWTTGRVSATDQMAFDEGCIPSSPVSNLQKNITVKSNNGQTYRLRLIFAHLLPYLVMDIFGEYPGLPGLFVAAAYSGSLSTVSSSINALALVTVEDFIKPHTDMSEKHLYWTSKGMSLLYGVLCIAMSGVASVMEGVLQASLSITGMIGGPLLGLFTLGILFPFANSKGALSGLASGLVLTLWVGIGAQMYSPPPELTQSLPLNTSGCNFNTTGSFNWTSNALPTQPSSAAAATTDINSRYYLADWYSLSYLYLSPLGAITTIIVGLLISLLTGGCKLDLESGLTLQREDTTTYYVFKLLKNGLTGTRGKLLLTNDRQKNCGNTNSAFSNVELDENHHGTSNESQLMSVL